MKVAVFAGKFRAVTKGHKQSLLYTTTFFDKIKILIELDNDYERHSTIGETIRTFHKIMDGIDCEYEIITYQAFAGLEDFEEYVLSIMGEDETPVMINGKEDYPNILLENKTWNPAAIDHNISVTNYEKTGDFNILAEEYLQFINKKIVITGVESCGKTQICTKLAKLFETEYSPEVGRFSFIKENFNDERTSTPATFVQIALEQIVQDKQVNAKAKGYVFVDTDPIVTLRFYMWYQEKYKLWDTLEYNEGLNVLWDLCRNYKYDKVFLLTPSVPFIQDGTRVDQDVEERYLQHKILKKLYDKFNIEYQELYYKEYHARLGIIEAMIRDGDL